MRLNLVSGSKVYSPRTMDRDLDAYSMGRASTVRRRSIVTITDKQRLSIDLSLTSTETFPSCLAGDKNSSRTVLEEKGVEMSTESTRQQEKEDEPVIVTVPQTPKYLSGTKLFVVMTCVAIVCWLLFLDSSIIVTVRVTFPGAIGICLADN